MVVAWNFVWEKRGLLGFGHEERERGEGKDSKKMKEICLI